MIDTALILAGGRGSRLGPLTDKTPKPMLNVGTKPIILHVINSLRYVTVLQIKLLTGYKSDHFAQFFAESNLGIDVVPEKQPLGTGGAIKQWLENSGSNGNLLIVNGDSLIFDDNEYLPLLANLGCDGMVGVQVNDRSRYGSVSFNENYQVTGFKEKGTAGPGHVNAGVYYFNDRQRLSMELKKFPRVFSFEDFLIYYISRHTMTLVPTAGTMIDMGTPEGLAAIRQKIES